MGSGNSLAEGIGIFGGTFDPVHFGHLRAALEVRELLGLRDFRLLPAGSPPHRANTFAGAEDRLAMLRLALDAYPNFQVDDREIRRGGFSYMADTLGEIRNESEDAPIMLMVGQDAANELDSWHEWRSIFELAHLVIMRRPDSRLAFSTALRGQLQDRWAENPEELKQKRAGGVLALEVTQLAISSTDIRRQLAAGHSPRFLLPDGVLEFIRRRGLYQD